MAVYQYEALTMQGKLIKGKMEADDENTVRTSLREKNYYPQEVKEFKQSALNLDLAMYKKIPVKDISIFCRQFSFTVSAGMNILKAMEIVVDQTENTKLKEILRQVKMDIEKGSGLSAALRRHKDFPEMLVNMVEVGESSGNLESVMTRMADYYDSSYKIQKKVKGALVYPVVTCIVAVIVVNILLIFVLPTFVGMIVSSGGKVPLPTRIVMGLSGFMKKYGIIMLGAVILLIILLKLYFRGNEEAAERFDTMKLNIPIFGKIIRQMITSNFARTFATLLVSGMPILGGMDICARTAGNRLIRHVLESTSEDVKKGRSIGISLESKRIFPTMLTQMMRIGEETGTLDGIMLKTADFYEDEVQTATEQLTTMITPLITIILGFVVGFIVVAMIMPMFDMYNAYAQANG